MNKILAFSKSGYTPMMITREPFDVQPVASDRMAISSVIVAKEDCHVKTENGYIEAKKGDIILTFYEDIFPNKVVVVPSEKWLENIDTYNAVMEERNNKVSNKPSCDDCVPDAECCKG